MTVVQAGEYTSRIYEWVVPTRQGGAVIGDVHDAIDAATVKYEELTGPSNATTFDDWLRVTWDDEGLTFWFETKESTPIEGVTP